MFLNSENHGPLLPLENCLCLHYLKDHLSFHQLNETSLRDIRPFWDWIPLFQAIFAAQACPIMGIATCDRARPRPENVAVSPRFDLHLIRIIGWNAALLDASEILRWWGV